MDDAVANIQTWWILILILGSLLLKFVFLSQDSREPPYIGYQLPIVGHTFGLLRQGLSFYEILRDKAKSPIYSIRILRKKIYVVTSPELISQLNRKPQTISAHIPFINLSFGKVLGLDQADLSLLQQNVHDAKPGASLRIDLLKLQHSLFKPGEFMKHIYLQTMQDFATRLVEFANTSPVRVNLMTFVKERFAFASAMGLYGSRNPFERNPGLLNDLRDFEGGFMAIVLNFFPSIIAAKSVRARQRLVQAFKEYHHSENKHGPDNMSIVIRETSAISLRYQCSDDLVARLELGEFIGTIINSGPTLFWFISMVVSDPVLLSQIRVELSEAVSVNDSRKRVLDIELIKTKCPLLCSTYREVVRLTVLSISTYAVLEDTELDGKYLLKKGAAIQVPSLAIHTDVNVWGSDAEKFVPDRFTRTQGSQMRPAAFRSFGGGATLCPGRFFATDVIIAMAAIMLTTFDFDGGNWKVSSMDRSRIGSRIAPQQAPNVTLSRRNLQDTRDWAFI